MTTYRYKARVPITFLYENPPPVSVDCDDFYDWYGNEPNVINAKVEIIIETEIQPEKLSGLFQESLYNHLRELVYEFGLDASIELKNEIDKKG